MTGTAAGLYNATVDLLERNLTAGRGSRPYLLTEQRAWSYQEVCEAADAAGAALLDLGLAAGDRVVLSTRDRPEFVITFWGAMKAGLVPVPVAEGLSASDINFILTDSEARVAVCDPASAPAVMPAVEGLDVICLMAGGPAADGARSWSDVCGRQATQIGRAHV